MIFFLSLVVGSDGLNNVQKRLPNLGILIENLQAEIEAEAESKLSKMDLLKKKFSF